MIIEILLLYNIILLLMCDACPVVFPEIVYFISFPRISVRISDAVTFVRPRIGSTKKNSITYMFAVTTAVTGLQVTAMTCYTYT